MNFTIRELRAYVVESNRIEGIERPSNGDLAALRDFLAADLSVASLVEYVVAIQPEAQQLFNELGLDKRGGPR